MKDMVILIKTAEYSWKNKLQYFPLLWELDMLTYIALS